MRIVIAGSSGQVGTNLALRCLDAGHDVLGFDRRPNTWSSRIPTVETDLARGGTLHGPRPDVVVHLAAHAKVHDLVVHPERAGENSRITLAVLEACRRWSTPLVFASSREVYGQSGRVTTGEDDLDISLVESPYAAAKIADETMIHAYARCYGLRFLVVRLSNVYGRYDNDLARMERVMPLFIDRIRQDAPIVVFGAEKVLDFTHVDDCVDGIVRGVERLVAGRLLNETVNLSGGRGQSLVEMAGFVADALGRKARISVAPARTGEITRYVADLSRARALLDFVPQVALRDGVERAIAWNAASLVETAA